MGEKSKTKPASGRDEGQINKKKLYIGGLAGAVTKEELQTLFPGSQSIQIEKRGLSA